MNFSILVSKIFLDKNIKDGIILHYKEKCLILCQFCAIIKESKILYVLKKEGDNNGNKINE